MLDVLAPTRSPVLPEVPTASEAGMSGIDMVVWTPFSLRKEHGLRPSQS
jgi:tripartite-type tricarboxylate transporter receptor subunit TctC